ncbi:MAG TPA: hypothetical protein VMK05_02535, partial [Burkholderiales bacterium]|nr:hypothetical protein [Burkholderiales bacterium]
LGPTRNFGLANVLCAPETLEAIAPSAVLHWAQPDALHPAPKQIAPGAIGVAKGSEQAHLRFLVGAGIAPADAPSLFETAANIGAWGKPLAQCLGRQLAQPGLQLLALPRPPQNLLAARHAGRFAQLEVAMQLFVSNAVRTIRRSSGDPVAIVAAHDNGDLRVTLSSPFDVGVVEGFRWPLHPLDDLADIERRMLRLLDECRVGDVRVIEAAMPDRDENGRTLYLQPRNTARFTASH